MLTGGEMLTGGITGSEIKDRPLVRDYQIVPRTSKYYNSVVRWTTEFIRNFSGTT